MDTNIIGKRIKDRRQELGITLQEIAEKINVNKSTIQRYENGKIKDIKTPIIESLAEYLSVDPLWLLGKVDNKTHSLEYERATHLMNQHYNAIVKWTDDVLFDENDTTILREHFWDLLLRYKGIIEAYAIAKSNWEIQEESFRKIYEDKYSDIEIREKYFESELKRQIVSTSEWINAFPNWVAREGK